MQSWFIVLVILGKSIRDTFVLFYKFLFVGCISTASTYQCYSCMSTIDGKCNDPFDSNGITKQDAAGAYVCMVRLVQSFS